MYLKLFFWIFSSIILALLGRRLLIDRSRLPQLVPTWGRGPAYIGMGKSSLVVTFPDRNSPSFMNDRNFDIEIFGSQYDTLYPRHIKGPDIRQYVHHVANATQLRPLDFTERLPTEKRYVDAHQFQEAARHVHISHIAQEKIKTIHPRFYKKLNKS